MSDWLIGQPSISPPPGARMPWWDRTRPRRAVGFFGRGAQVAVYNPRYRAMIGLLAFAVAGQVMFGPVGAASVAVLAAIAFVVWVFLRPADVKQSLYGWWRSNRRYRWKWERTLRRCGAAKIDTPVPLLVSVRSTTKYRLPLVDKLRVKVPTGLDPTAFQDYRGELLKWGWKAESCRVYNPHPANQTIELWNLIHDPLVETVTPFQRPTEPLPKAGWPIALIEDGQQFLLKIRGGATHVFVCGISGAGKGSYIGSVLDQAHQDIQDGLVVALGIDPQASELGMWSHLFKKLVYSQKDAAELLEWLVGVMDTRTRSIFGISRQHHPTEGDPFYELIIDEGLDLLDKTNRKLYRRIDTALRQLLRKGRKASIRVSFISQRAELEIVEIRKDFPIAIAFQLRYEGDVDMVLGRGSLRAGAKAHELSLPGECLIATEQGIVRARFPYFSDDYIRNLDPAPGNEEPENRPPPPQPEPEQDGLVSVSLSADPESKPPASYSLPISGD